MADKSIVELGAAQSMTDDALLPVYQGGETKRIEGSLIKQYARESAELYVESAARSAEQAKKYADSVDPEQIDARIAAKADNLYFDEGEKLLYLTSGGEIISDGIAVSTGGGGGGGSGNNAVLALTNTSGWIYKTISYGAACPISLEWSSLENGLSTGRGVLKVAVSGVLKHTEEVDQGDVSLDIGPMLPAGSSTVKVSVTDVYGNTRTLNFNLTTVSLTLTSSFDADTVYTGDITYPYIPTGIAAKTVLCLVDGVEAGRATVTASGRQQSFTIPAQSHGSHTLEVYFTAEVDGGTVESNHLYYDLVCVEPGNTTPIITSSFREETVEQYESIAVPYLVYDPVRLTAAVTLSANGAQAAALSVDRTRQVWTYRPDDFGELTLTIACGETVKTFALTVTESTIAVEAETADLGLYLSSYGRSNREENPGVWVYGDISAQFQGFNWASDGWQADEEGVTVLRVSGDARLTIPLEVFGKDFRTTGKTIEVEFATREVLDYDAIVLSCLSGGRGLALSAQTAQLISEQSDISTQYKEDEHVRLSFVVQKRAEHRLILVYLNGVLSRAAQYPEDDDFSQVAPVGITVGSNDCTVDLYCIRVYDNDLTRHQVLDNWIADTQSALERALRYQHNDVFDDYGQIAVDRLPQDLPYLIVDAGTLPQYKGDKKTVTGSYTDPTDPTKSFTFTGAEIDVQGTSSQYYARKNYKMKFKGGFNAGGQTAPTYQLRADSIPTNTFTFKADVASSEGANNVELVRLYDDACPYRTPPQGDDFRVRQGIDGFPIVVFQNDGSKTTFIGKYNFNNDKGTAEVYGFAAGDESWEILNNTSDRVLFRSADFSGADWQNDFESRYPEDSTDATRLRALSQWLVSTDRAGATGEPLSAPVTYGEKTYTHDTEECRLARFRAELAQHMEVDSALFYYLFTELFLMVDSRAKNAFPSRLGGDKWCWLPYDMDTAIGTNNEGALVFGYALEDIDQVGGADVYNGQNSVLWSNLRAAYYDELRTMYQTLRSTGALSYQDTEGRFAAHQDKWPEAVFNEDSYFKYLQPLIEDNSAAYLGMLQGSKAEQRKWWLYNRYRYLDAKYNAGDSLSDTITLRGYAKADITVTPYADIYAGVKYGSYLVQARALRGNSYTLACPLDNVNDTEIYLYSASQLSDVGDLSGLMVGYAEFSLATRLKSLKLGDGAADYANPNLTELHLGNNVLLRTIDVRNCPNLTQAVDLSGCVNVEEVYFEGTAITGCGLPNGGILKALRLPGTVTNLTIRNQPAITEFVMPDYRGVTTLRLEQVSGAVPEREILAAIPEGSRVRLVGFDWSFNDAADILTLYDRLDTMRGLDEGGNNVDRAQLSGKVRVATITGAQLAEMDRRYPTVAVVYEHITSNLYFYSEDGGMLLYAAAVTDGGNGAYVGADPTKASTAQYAYTFAGWSLTPGGAADQEALKAVTADRNVYAAFTATVRTYTVRFYNDAALLQTAENVPYGGAAVYTGDTPVKAGVDDPTEYQFTGWNPPPNNIQGDTDCAAEYRFIGLVSSKLISRTLSGAYQNDRVTSIGNQAFDDCTALTTADFPQATSIGNYAFDGCTALTTADLPQATSIGSYVFRSCTTLTTLILRVASKVCTLGSGALNSTPIASGTGYIYVPSALVEEYKAASGWSAYANQIRAIEDWPEITGGDV